MDLTEPHSGPSLGSARASRWRRLPLTAQLGAIGLVVAVAWFFTARLAADRMAAEAALRSEAIERLQQGEVAAVRIMASVAAMSSAHGGFILTGAEELPARYEIAYRAFGLDVSVVRHLVSRNPQLVRTLDSLEAIAGRWDGEVVAPNFEHRRRAGYAGFSPGTAGYARLTLGAEFYEQLRNAHAQVVRDLRGDLIRLEAEAETSAALNEWENFLIRAAAVAVFLLLLILLMRVVAQSLNRVVVAAEALEAGRYAAARLPYSHKAPNQETARLAHTFDRLALSIATRERQLQDDILKLKELEALKADFVSTVSHELRTPLTSMRGALGLLLGGAGGELAPKGRELLRIALTNTDRLIRLINDILDIEKMDAGHVDIRRDRVRILPMLEATLTGLDGLARDTGVKLVLTDVEDVEVIGDSDRLIQVMTNLVSNAVKFSPAGASVEVSARSFNGIVKIAVRDYGPGISPEFASRIFGRFQQAGGAASRQSGGTGLGLSIAKAITELHGGRIGFENAPDTGTIFHIQLSVASAPTGDADERAGVLIVEDDDSMRTVISALLEPFARTITVPDAASAIRALGKHRVQVIILDHGLPGMDGLAFARRLRTDSRFRKVTILLYSANEFTPDDLRESGIRISDAFVKTRDHESSLIDRVKRELQGSYERKDTRE